MGEFIRRKDVEPMGVVAPGTGKFLAIGATRLCFK